MRTQEMEVNNTLNNFDILTTYYKISAQEKPLLLSAIMIGVKFGVSDITYPLTFKDGFEEFIEFVVSITTENINVEKNVKVINNQYRRLLVYDVLHDEENVSKLFRILSTYKDGQGRIIRVKVDKKTGEVKEIKNK